MEKRIMTDMLNFFVNNPDTFRHFEKELEQQLVDGGCIYGDKSLPISPMALILTQQERDDIDTASDLLSRIIDKTIDLCMSDDAVFDYFKFEGLIGEWMRRGGVNKLNTQLSRLDALISHEGVIKFIEFNTDNPGGQGWTDTYEYIYYHNSTVNPLLRGRTEPPNKRIVQSVYEVFLRESAKFWGRSDINVCFVDLKDSYALEESKLIVNYFNDHGLNAFLVDPRELKLKDGVLYSGNQIVHTVHRSMMGWEFVEIFDSVKDLINAYLDGQILMINSYRANVGSQKSILAFLCNEQNNHYFTREEIDCIQKYIPKTYRLNQPTLVDFDGSKVTMEKFVKGNKNRLVFKPSSGSGGRGVMVGNFTDKDVWEKQCQEVIGNKLWTVQEYVPLPKLPIPVVQGDKVVVQEKFFNICPYVFGRKCPGILARYSDHPIINVEAGGGVMAVYTALPETKPEIK
jgi:glutathionylspermidine synthase